MVGRGLLAGLLGAALAAGGASAQSVEPVRLPAAATEARFGIVRVRIDPAVGEQGAEIRQLLAAHDFVRIGEPADYLLTTEPDFPLDIILVDLRQPRQHWDEFDENQQPKEPEPRQFPVGNLRSEDTPERLGNLLAAAARLRAILDRSQKDMQGVEACLLIKHVADAGGVVRSDDANPPTECLALGGAAPNFLYSAEAAGIVVRNASDGDRYVAALAADGSLRIGGFDAPDGLPVKKLAPGEKSAFRPILASIDYDDDPRIMLLVSSQPLTLDGLAQPAPLQPTEACRHGVSQGCEPVRSGIALNEDVAVRSFQMLIANEPMPAMGHGSDVTAAMAVWMAQFYSVLPYSREEIEADAKLPEDQRQFLGLRTYEERQHRCGGTLIGPNLVVTAAHCVAKGQYAGQGLAKVMKDRRVRLGSRKIGQGGESFAIAGVAVHSDYIPDRQNHDIALLLLRPDRGTGTNRQQPVAVADRPLPGGANALAFGWGLTGAVAPNGNIMMTVDQRLQRNADVLQYGEMTSVTLDQCRRKLADKVAPGMVCMFSKAALAGAPSADGVFTCRGDSGGPLVRKAGGREELVGVVSWSMGCGYKDYPSVFTDAGRYAKWIAAARQQLLPGAAIRVPEPAAPSR